MIDARRRIKQIADECNLSRQALLAIIHDIRPPSANYRLDEAMDWLQEQLKHGEVQSKHLNARAAKVGINRTTLYRAALNLGVKPKVTGYGKRKRSFWRLR
jgi:DNA-binding phage protein